MGKSNQITVRIESQMHTEIEDYLAAELRQGREMTVAGFTRMAIRRVLAEEQARRDPEN